MDNFNDSKVFAVFACNSDLKTASLCVTKV